MKITDKLVADIQAQGRSVAEELNSIMGLPDCSKTRPAGRYSHLYQDHQPKEIRCNGGRFIDLTNVEIG